MSVPKLTYFAIRGRGELIRLVMAAAQKQLDEVKVDFASWEEMKPSLYGSTNLECLMIDQIVQLKEDILTVEIDTVLGSDQSKIRFIHFTLTCLFGNSGPIMSKPRMTYFKYRGRGELSRLVMAAAGKELDQRIVDVPTWLKMKPNTFFQRVPFIEIDGQEYFQGNAIATYLARENGLYGSTNLECLMIDQIVQMKEDILLEEIKSFVGSDDQKDQAAKDLPEVVYPRVMQIFERLIQQNPSKSGFVIGNKMTLADLAIFEGTQSCYQGNPRFMSNFPELMKLRQKVAEADGVRQYLATRKQTGI
ncbi:glutathione s-transferase [Plakobranchus ocellatus]|uniref:Glutathione s-transferase n=1 Tax=Plakobranchus ocellatus TaxID=259542 RepID=A0AAV4BP12_9GAST|nr:glutathione s-transferase [Plakobranchus ocellatus]